MPSDALQCNRTCTDTLSEVSIKPTELTYAAAALWAVKASAVPCHSPTFELSSANASPSPDLPWSCNHNEQLHFKENHLTWIGITSLCFFMFSARWDCVHASCCCNALPESRNHSSCLFSHTRGRAQCLGNRCALTSLALSKRRGSVDAHLFKKGLWKSRAHICFCGSRTWSAQGEFWRGGRDWSSDKTPAFIFSSASQELFDYAVSAICACVIQPSPSVGAAALRLSVPLLFSLFQTVTS